MFTKIIDIVFRSEEAEFPEDSDDNPVIAFVWLVWFSIMLFLVISVI